VPFELRDHTADVAVEATAPTLSDLFASVADGFTAASCEHLPDVGDRFELTVSAESRDALLFDYLDRLVYERDVRGVLPAAHDCAVDVPDVTGGDATGTTPADGGVTDRMGVDSDEAWTVTASARGVPLSAVAAREIKAVTYSEMTVEERADGWYAYVVFDV